VNQLTKCRAFYDYKTFQLTKATTNYRMHDLKLPLLTIGVTLNNVFNAHFSVACVVGSCHRTTEGRFHSVVLEHLSARYDHFLAVTTAKFGIK